MVVGVCRLTFALPGVDSLKGKRSIVRRVIERCRAKFNVAMAEVGQMDSHRRAVIGLSVVSNDPRHANSMIDTIVSYASSATEAMVIDRSMEILTIEDHFGRRGEPDAAIDRAYDEPEGDDGR